MGLVVALDEPDLSHDSQTEELMKVDYDSEADAISIRLASFDRYDDQEQVDDDFCNVGFVAGQAVDVELLSPARHLDLLHLAARPLGHG